MGRKRRLEGKQSLDTKSNKLRLKSIEAHNSTYRLINCRSNILETKRCHEQHNPRRKDELAWLNPNKVLLSPYVEEKSVKEGTCSSSTSSTILEGQELENGLELDILREILIREEILKMLENVLYSKTPGTTLESVLCEKLSRYRQSSVQVLNTIAKWQNDNFFWKELTSDNCNFSVPFIYKGKNYTQKMYIDSSQLSQRPLLIQYCKAVQIPLQRNPLFLDAAILEKEATNLSTDERSFQRSWLSAHNILVAENCRVHDHVSQCVTAEARMDYAIDHEITSAHLRTLRTTGEPDTGMLTLLKAISIIFAPASAPIKPYLRGTWNQVVAILDDPVVLKGQLQFFEPAMHLSNAKISALYLLSDTGMLNPKSFVKNSPVAFQLSLWIHRVIDSVDDFMSLPEISKAKRPFGSSRTQHMTVEKSCILKLSNSEPISRNPSLLSLSDFAFQAKLDPTSPKKRVYVNLRGGKIEEAYVLMKVKWIEEENIILIAVFSASTCALSSIVIRHVHRKGNLQTGLLDLEDIKSIACAAQSQLYWPNHGVDAKSKLHIRPVKTVIFSKNISIADESLLAEVFSYDFECAIELVVRKLERLKISKGLRVKLLYGEIDVLMLTKQSHIITKDCTNSFVCHELISKLINTRGILELNRILVYETRVFSNGRRLRIAVLQVRNTLKVYLQELSDGKYMRSRVAPLTLTLSETLTLCYTSNVPTKDGDVRNLDKLLERASIREVDRVMTLEISKILYSTTIRINGRSRKCLVHTYGEGRGLKLELVAEEKDLYDQENTEVSLSFIEIIHLLQKELIPWKQIEQLMNDTTRYALCSILPEIIWDDGKCKLRAEGIKTAKACLVEVVVRKNGVDRLLGSLDCRLVETFRSLRQPLKQNFGLDLMRNSYAFLYKDTICGVKQERRRKVISCNGRITLVKRHTARSRKSPLKKTSIKNWIQEPVTALEKDPVMSLENTRIEESVAAPIPSKSALVKIKVNGTMHEYHLNLHDSIRSFLCILVPCIDQFELVEESTDKVLDSNMSFVESGVSDYSNLTLRTKLPSKELSPPPSTPKVLSIDLNRSDNIMVDKVDICLEGNKEQNLSPKSINVRLSDNYHVNKGSNILKSATGASGAKEYYQDRWVLRKDDCIFIGDRSYTVKKLLPGKEVILNEAYDAKSELFVTITKNIACNPDPRFAWELEINRWLTEDWPKEFKNFQKKFQFFGVTLRNTEVLPAVTEELIEDSYRDFSPVTLAELYYQNICSWCPASALMDGAKFLKFCKVFNLISSKLEKREIDLIFAKCRNSKTKRLKAPDFFKALNFIANKVIDEELNDRGDRIIILLKVVGKSFPETEKFLFRTAGRNAVHQHAKLICSVICIQSHMRRVLPLVLYKKLKRLAIIMQALGRGFLSRRLWYDKVSLLPQLSPEERMNNSSTKIQMQFRQHRIRKRIDSKLREMRILLNRVSLAKREAQRSRKLYRYKRHLYRDIATIGVKRGIVSIDQKTHYKDAGILISLYIPDSCYTRIFLVRASQIESLIPVIGETDSSLNFTKEAFSVVSRQLCISKGSLPDSQVVRLRLKAPKEPGYRIYRRAKKIDGHLLIMEAFYTRESTIIYRAHQPSDCSYIRKQESMHEWKKWIPENLWYCVSNVKDIKQCAKFVNYAVEHFHVLDSPIRFINSGEMEDITRNNMARKIHRFVVCKQGRDYLVLKIRRRFVKARVGTWIQYVDTRTGAYFNQKPKLLGSSDLVEPDDNSCWVEVYDLANHEKYYLNRQTGFRSAISPSTAATQLQIFFKMCIRRRRGEEELVKE